MRELEPGIQQTPIEYNRSDAIGELVDQYNALLKQLQAAVEELGKREREGAWRMMAMQVAHEIKNPLTPIKLGAQQLERAWVDEKEDFDERLRRYTRIVVEQIDILAEISQDFSLLAAVGLERLEDVALDGVVHEVVELFRQSHPELDWKVDIPEGDWVLLGSRQHLTRALNNLISNAVDATGSCDAPRIVIRLQREESGLCLTVQDNGIGIEPDRLDAIFQPRFTLKKHGTGLGLTITKSIVHQLQGTISVSSEHGAGSVFIVSFPTD